MASDGFLISLGDFPVDMAGISVETIVSLWNGEMHRTIDSVAPECDPCCIGACRAHWSDLYLMKQEGQWLQNWCKLWDGVFVRLEWL